MLKVKNDEIEMPFLVKKMENLIQTLNKRDIFYGPIFFIIVYNPLLLLSLPFPLLSSMILLLKLKNYIKKYCNNRWRN